ncbi:pyocin immunity protein [Pseudomonas yamanorum]|uniref:Pyocin immunity protein n=1 Tax=Pseudomonas yamanorum TaxID=515393 RepID=A0A7Y8EK57_9PSED|nr:pyocin immunity protein [Pseudomonas yamanorum]NWE15635.1 pyocin immunity protein [Pseudomonas yamanorum]NWE40603.1 pyocin immunity protein [Pseudomonas yamanorum]
MDAEKIQHWVTALGREYHELVREGTGSGAPLMPLFEDDDNEDLIQKPIAGIELWFSADTHRLKEVLIILVQTVGQPVYIGQLPAPFTLNMDQSFIRNVLGTPMDSIPPARLPGVLGIQGGSDTYAMDQKTHLNVKVTFSYLENLVVNNICFSLITEGHD